MKLIAALLLVFFLGLTAPLGAMSQAPMTEETPDKARPKKTAKSTAKQSSTKKHTTAKKAETQK